MDVLAVFRVTLLVARAFVRVKPESPLAAPPSSTGDHRLRARMKASTSARRGKEVWAPRFVQVRAAAAFASGRASSHVPPAASPTASAPLNASPAPVVSTASTGNAGKWK